MNGAPASLTLAGIGRGFKLTVGLAVTSFPFGVSFGAAALVHDLPAYLAVLMSSLIFAGGAQFAALEFLSPMMLWPLLLTTFAVNARHIVMGATLAPWMRSLPPLARWSAVAFISDVNWTIASDAHGRGENDVGVLVGGGLALWLGWVSGTAIGAIAGADLGDLNRLGLDLILIAFFAATLAGQWRSRRDFAPWFSAGLTTLIAVYVLPPGWPVIAGALAGGCVGALTDES